MARQLTRSGRLVMMLAGLSLLGYAVHRYGLVDALRSRVASRGAGQGDEAPERSARVRLDVLYGTEKERWLKTAVEEYAKRRPEVAVELRGLGTIESVRAIADGREKPTVWAPADEVALNLLDAEWALKTGQPLVERSEERAPQPLVLTPLVMIAWEERARALAAATGGDPTDWRAIHALATNPKGWLGVGAPAEWGYVKPGHTAPNASNSGLQTLILMAYGYHQKRSGLRPADVLHEGFQAWLREIETAVSRFGSSSGTYMREMVLYGPSKYDIIWNYENVAISEMAAAQGRWGNLAVYYPKPTLWSNHPFVLLKGDWVSPEQAAAALELRAFLLTPEVQARALEFGFRPANPEVKVVTEDPQNPWNRLKPFGVRLEVPAVVEPPAGEVTRLLVETWRRVVETAPR
jgi:ABC-type Fe3+ transport system substrate-binding protein